MRRALPWLLALLASRAWAWEVEGSLRLLNRLNYQKNAPQTQLLFDETMRRFHVEDYLVPSIDHLFSTHVLGAFLDLAFGSGWSFTATADSGALRVGQENVVDNAVFQIAQRRFTYPVVTTRTQIGLTANSVPFSEEAQRSLFLREAYFTYSPHDWLRVVFGKRRMVLADGFLLDQFTFGAGLRLNAAQRPSPSPWRLDADVLVADGSWDSGGKSSPLVQLGLHYVPGPFQHFGLTLIYFHDGNNLLTEVLRTSVTESSIERAVAAGIDRSPLLAVQIPLESSGDLFWFGLSGKRFLGDHTFAGALFGQAGRVKASAVLPVGGTPLVRQLDATATGLLADFSYQYDVTEDLVLGGFFTFATGDDALAEAFRAQAGRVSSLGVFLSIFPFVNRTNLFFNGGLNAELTTRKASTLGVNARGLMTGGAFVRWEGPGLTLEGRAAALGAHRPSIYDGRYYGTEVDLNLRARLGRNFHLVLESDALFAGSFFGRARTIVQLIVGLDVTAP